MIDSYYPYRGWLPLQRDTLEALRRRKVERGLPTYDQAVLELLEATAPKPGTRTGRGRTREPPGRRGAGRLPALRGLRALSLHARRDQERHADAVRDRLSARLCRGPARSVRDGEARVRARGRPRREAERHGALPSGRRGAPQSGRAAARARPRDAGRAGPRRDRARRGVSLRARGRRGAASSKGGFGCAPSCSAPSWPGSSSACTTRPRSRTRPRPRAPRRCATACSRCIRCCGSRAGGSSRRSSATASSARRSPAASRSTPSRCSPRTATAPCSARRSCCPSIPSWRRRASATSSTTPRSRRRCCCTCRRSPTASARRSPSRTPRCAR